MSEADTRAKLIDPALHAVGWHEDMIAREETAGPIEISESTPRRRTKGRVDYLLRAKIPTGLQPVALAVIEAKSDDCPPGFGLDQAKDYCRRLNIKFAFSSNGHQFVEYDSFTGLTSQPKPVHLIPNPSVLIARYENGMGFKLSSIAAKPLATPYPKGEAARRYYQDAAIRAVFEKIAKGENRALLSLATGTGKTFIAVNLLKRIADSGQLRRALFVCDRDELRLQALKEFRKEFGSDVAEVKSGNPQKNARVLIATYQTLNVDTEEAQATFLTENYPENYFSHIIIDECHRSAWNKWHEVLKRNKEAIQVGLTATPREIEIKENTKEAQEDQRILADNLRYFGEPAYVYSMTQAMDDGYLAVCELVRRDIFLERKTDKELETGLEKNDLQDNVITDHKTGEQVSADDLRDKYHASSFENFLMLPDRVKTMCQDLFGQLVANGDGNPLQKSIVFCVRDTHAQAVADELNNIYAAWCQKNGRKRAEPFAFKCTAASFGSEHISELRGLQNSHFIATTVDLLTTGVDVPCVRNIVFFRYVGSPIAFHQMVGRGTRLDPPTNKLMFRIYDYTDASRLFGQDFKTALQTKAQKQPPTSPLQIIQVEGVDVHISDAGRYIITDKDGVPTPMTIEEYKELVAEKLVKMAPSIEDFRQRWVEPQKRREMLENLPESGRSASIIRELEDMKDFDLFDVLAELCYRQSPLNRVARAFMFAIKNRNWLDKLPAKTNQTLSAILKHFELSGTEALESVEIFKMPDVQDAGGLLALKTIGDPAQVLKVAKERLFAA